MKSITIFLLCLLCIFPIACNADEDNLPLASIPEEIEPSNPFVYPSLNIFIHVCTINHWQDVLERQLLHIKNSGLYEHCQSIQLGILGDGDITHFIEKYPKVSVIFQSPDKTLFERPTLNALHHFCCNNPNALVLYLHTKGVRYEQINNNITDWCLYMEYYAIEKWQNCVEALKDHDACGVNWSTGPSPHFSGNFWWATAKYVSTLPNKIEKAYLDPEMWIGLNSPNIKCFQYSRTNHYKYPFPEFEYKCKDRRYFLVAVPKDRRYFLVAVPGGIFGNSINNYWNKVKNSNLNHHLFTHSTPHCKLTQMFTCSLTREELKNAITDIYETVKFDYGSKKIQIAGLVKNGRLQEKDFIKIKSMFLLNFTWKFVNKLKLPNSIIKGAQGIFQIILREKKFDLPNNILRIHNLQDTIKLHADVHWKICIFKMNEDNLEFFTGCPIEHIN